MRVSVVVATYGRAAMLTRLLDAIAMQELDAPFEVVVVDDASPDDTQLVLEARRQDPYALVTLCQARNGGPAAARNRGWRAARGELVCFTDDDCVPQPGWLRALVEGLGIADVAQGRTVPNPDQLDSWGPFSLTIERRSEDGFYETCNIGYRRVWLEQLGGFDERFRYAYGEDSDLAWRAREAGARTTFCENAVVHHEVWPFRWQAVLRDLRRREGAVLLVKNHPDLRRLFPYGGLFQKETHVPALVAAAGLAVAARRPGSLPRLAVAGGAVVAYYRVCRKRRRGPQRLRQWPVVLPGMLALDLAEVASLASASWRLRSLLL